LLSDLKFTVPRADRAHQYLVFRLSNSGDSSTERAGRNLDTLRRLRNRADYDETPAITQPQADAAFNLAEAVIQALDAGRKNPRRTQISDAMKSYERDVLKEVTWRP
jgi:hypothetical protein